MNRYPTWKYCLLLLVLVIGVIYALPTLFGQNPSVQVSSPVAGATLTANDLQTVKQALIDKKLGYKSIQQEGKSVVILFATIDQQQLAQDYLKALFTNRYSIAISLAPAAPRWLLALGAEPIRLGLDLQGGVHFLLQVDTQAVQDERVQTDLHNIADSLRDQRIRYSGIELHKPSTIQLTFQDPQMLTRGIDLLGSHFPEYVWRTTKSMVTGQLTPSALLSINQYAVAQTIETLKRRVNELGVTEATVQQQGADRIAVDMPGVQDATQARDLLGKTATLEFHLVDTMHDPMVAAQGVAPPGSQLFFYHGQPILLKDQVVLTGDSISSATSGFDQNGSSSVNIVSSGQGNSNFYRITGENIGKPMATVYIETKSYPVMINGKQQIVYKLEKNIISIATIQNALSGSFQITGLANPDEAKNLAQLLRAGALVAPVTIIAENNVGPSMGQQNIHLGMLSILIGLVCVVVFMMIYYSVFGVIADIALLLNLIFLVAVMSLLGAVLSFPGIAAMVLTLGMAVDQNVLIFERIREELRHHVSVQTAINAGYEKAFATIVDANVTTLIAAMVLFSIGSGPIKAFAITLTIGIITSMCTAIAYTRAIVNSMFGGRKIGRLPIGIKVKPQQGGKN